MNALITEERHRFHQLLVSNGVLSLDKDGIPSNADSSSRYSVIVARHMAETLGATTQPKVKGQTLGARFEQACMDFLQTTFPRLQNLRPGKWHFSRLGNRSSIKTSSFSQYEHLEHLSQLTKNDAELAACMGTSYMVAPDIVIYREPEPDECINKDRLIVDEKSCTCSDLRASANPLPILHASVSAKWTMRSDRAQNSRTEALGLIRNRKGRLPHIVVITGEPLPSRLASLALGTGDIDCVYHFALQELLEAVEATEAEDSLDLLHVLIRGKRLRDISDLPLDLAV